MQRLGKRREESVIHLLIHTHDRSLLTVELSHLHRISESKGIVASVKVAETTPFCISPDSCGGATPGWTQVRPKLRKPQVVRVGILPAVRRKVLRLKESNS